MGARRGALFVIAGPSGVGKGTVVSEVRRRLHDPPVVSVSATTRPPRPDEVDGVDYDFVEDEDFDRMGREGELLEWAEVFHGHRYGTPAGPVELHRSAGRDVLLEIDVEGARQVRERVPDAVLILDRHGAPTFTNQATRDLFGIDDPVDLVRDLSVRALLQTIRDQIPRMFDAWRERNQRVGQAEFRAGLGRDRRVSHLARQADQRPHSAQTLAKREVLKGRHECARVFHRPIQFE